MPFHKSTPNLLAHKTDKNLQIFETKPERVRKKKRDSIALLTSIAVGSLPAHVDQRRRGWEGGGGGALCSVGVKWGRGGSMEEGGA